MFSEFVIAYLFLGGTGGGALVVLALLECANARRRFSCIRITSGLFSGPGPSGLTSIANTANPANAASAAPAPASRIRRLFALPDDVLRNGWVVCSVMLALGILFLFMDLGHPERVFALLTHPNFSAITVGAYALIAALICSTAFCLLALNGEYLLRTRGIYILSALCVLAGITVILYTGILLASAPSVLIWMTPLVPVLFALSSISGGIACVMLGAAFANTRQVFDRVLIRLGDIDTALIGLELIALAVWLVWGILAPGPDASAKALVTGELAPIFWGGLIVLGLVLPILMEQSLNYSNHKTQTLMVAALVLLGGILLRVCVVGAGSFDVTQTGEFIGQMVQTAAAPTL